jgi:large subunit ribosomal protein L21
MQSYLRLMHSGVRRRLPATVLRDANHAQAPRSASNNVSRFSTDEASSSFSAPASAPPSRYAVIDHSEAYETAMQGPHGQQLALARLEGLGKDELPFDPFLEEELAALGTGRDDDMDYDDDDVDEDEYGDDVVEAEYMDDDEEDDDDEDDDDEDEDEDDAVGPYNKDGSVRRPKSVLATLRAGFPAGGLLSIIELGGAQHKVTTDDLIVVNRLKPVETWKIGSVHTLTDVMLVGSSHLTLVGIPFVAGAEVDLMVEEITRNAKVIIFKKRRRKHSQRKNGFRRDVTLLRVLDIRMPAEYKDHQHVGREIVDELEDRSMVEHTEPQQQSLSSPEAATSKLSDPVEEEEDDDESDKVVDEEKAEPTNPSDSQKI